MVDLIARLNFILDTNPAFAGHEYAPSALHEHWHLKAMFAEPIILKTAVGGEVFLTQRRREAENAEKIEDLWFYRSDLNNLLFHPLGDVLLQRNLMRSSSYSQNSRHSLRSQPLCGSA